MLNSGQELGRHYGIESNEDDRQWIAGIALQLMPQLNAAQALLLGDVLFADAPVDERIRRIVELARSPNPERPG